MIKSEPKNVTAKTQPQ